jgi:hypothetical protein
MRPDDAWSWVRALGRIGGAPELDELLAALRPGSVPAVADALAEHDVTEVALANLRAACPRGDAGRALVASVDALVAERAAYRTEIQPVMRDVLERTASLGGHVLHGLAMLRLYADPGLRHMGDIDIHMADLAGALELTRDLRCRGWAWDPGSLPWLSWDDGGQVYGKLPLLLREGGRLLTYADVRFGPYYVGYSGAMPLELEAARVWDVVIPAPTPECTIAMLAGNASDDFRLTMKDVNDVAETAARRPVDWGRVESFARPLGLERVTRQLAAAAGSTYGVGSPYAGERADRPLPVHRRRGLPAAMHRAGVTLRHERRRRSLWRAAARGATALAYHTIDVTPRPGGPWPRRSAPGRGYRWRLVPEEVWRALAGAGRGRVEAAAVEDLSAELRLVRGDGACVVTWRGDVFVPTVWGRLAGPSLALARSVRAGAGR